MQYLNLTGEFKTVGPGIPRKILAFGFAMKATYGKVQRQGGIDND